MPLNQKRNNPQRKRNRYTQIRFQFKIFLKIDKLNCRNYTPNSLRSTLKYLIIMHR